MLMRFFIYIQKINICFIIASLQVKTANENRLNKMNVNDGLSSIFIKK
jgi:hypothetical protein